MQGYDDDRLIMTVAQQPFEAGFNQFCKLMPLCYVDGTPASSGDFLNDGEIWWMLTLQSARLAEPGHLVMGSAEGAVRYDEYDPDSSRYQAIRESVRAVDPNIAREVLDMPGDVIERVQEIVDGGFTLEVDHLPTPQVMLRWRGDVYGPSSTTAGSMTTGELKREISFAPADSDMVVYQLSDAEFRAAVGDSLLSLSSDVSTTRNRRSEGRGVVWVHHTLLVSVGFDQFLAQNPKRLVLEPLRQKLLRFAKSILANRQRRELNRLLNDLELKGQEAEEAEDLLQTIRSVKQTIEHQNDALDAVTKRLRAF